MNNIVCSYGCVATTDSQCAGTVRDLTCDELYKMLYLLQKQSEDEKEKTINCDNCDNKETMCHETQNSKETKETMCHETQNSKETDEANP